MFDRKPDTAVVEVKTEDPTAGPLNPYSTSTLSIEGRFEPLQNSIGKDLDYSGKFYCQRIPELDINPNYLDGMLMVLQGKKIAISKAHNYQSHCEIWLD